eukprot:NODE_4575_length_569_cov_214.057692_g3327_i0.p1 GENE.NODE_4575_length_569_cov_214.057692_g3327_i0~~NODE_4575_length_569_cov_214.057692_g3327_i0.p1  ORF type:complete len:93 (-),score=29.20 NODE_4575_length_569_cov_214.057692_g3327_i0:263-541(-)
MGVKERGPADAAGLVPGDVVVALNGTTVYSRADYKRIIKQLKPGDSVAHLVQRGGYGDPFTIDLLLGAATGGSPTGSRRSSLVRGRPEGPHY